MATCISSEFSDNGLIEKQSNHMANTEISSDFNFYKLIYINTILDVAP